VLSLDEKTSLQPRPRPAPTLPAQPHNLPNRVEHEYKRAGALHFFAAFDTRSGKVYGHCDDLKWQRRLMELRIVDDGQGFDLAAARRNGGLGLISIDERVRPVQGGVQIVTEPRRGIELRVRIPLHTCEGTPREEEDAPRKSAVG
jgi:hypothetical protein